MDVPVQYFQSLIAVETAVTGVLLFQLRFLAQQSAAQCGGTPVGIPAVENLIAAHLQVEQIGTTLGGTDDGFAAVASLDGLSSQRDSRLCPHDQNLTARLTR